MEKYNLSLRGFLVASYRGLSPGGEKVRLTSDKMNHLERLSVDSEKVYLRVGPNGGKYLRPEDKDALLRVIDARLSKESGIVSICTGKRKKVDMQDCLGYFHNFHSEMIREQNRISRQVMVNNRCLDRDVPRSSVLQRKQEMRSHVEEVLRRNH